MALTASSNGWIRVTGGTARAQKTRTSLRTEVRRFPNSGPFMRSSGTPECLRQMGLRQIGSWPNCLEQLPQEIPGA